jgi:hypothetical protein
VIGTSSNGNSQPIRKDAIGAKKASNKIFKYNISLNISLQKLSNSIGCERCDWRCEKTNSPRGGTYKRNPSRGLGSSAAAE